MDKETQKPTVYPHPLREISSNTIRSLDREDQLEIMRAWFSSNFENPVERCPYESAEGGYQYIYGGPYDASNELHREFGKIVDGEIINELAEELNQESFVWSGIPSEDWYDDYRYESTPTWFEIHEAFKGSIAEIRRLLAIAVPTTQEPYFHRLLYANVITALETYLADVFVGAIKGNKNHLRKFVETNKHFQGQKLALSDLFKAADKIEDTVKSHLTDIVWHNLDRVKPMFQSTFNIRLALDGELVAAVLRRHDIVHRNGKTKDGEPVIVNVKDIEGLIGRVESLVSDVEKQRIKNGIGSSEELLEHHEDQS